MISNPEHSEVDLVKHLYKDEENMDSSVNKLVEREIDVNTLKINRFLEIRKKESNIKYMY